MATKVPPKNRIWPAPDGVDPAETFPGDHIRASLEKGLRVSGLEAFDLLQFHVWSDEWVGRGDWLETIEDLKQKGRSGSSACRSTTISRTMLWTSCAAATSMP